MSTTGPAFQNDLTPSKIALARNAALNVVAQGLPIATALVAIPHILHALGIGRFGLLSLIWVVGGYSLALDLGFGRATTKYVAELLGCGRMDEASEAIWTSMLSQLLIGTVGGAALTLVAPAMSESVFRLPLELQGEGRGAISILALGLPAMLATGSLLGSLEAHGRFDLSNAVRIPNSTANYVVPLLTIICGIIYVPTIVGLVVAFRWMLFVSSVILNLKLRLLRFPPKITAHWLNKLLGFGIWSMISAIIIPFTTYLDRFLVARLVSVEQLAYYSIAYDLANKLLVISSAVATVAFPMFSKLGRLDYLTDMLAQSTRLILMGTAVPCAVMLAYAEPVLLLWGGRDVAEHGTTVFRMLIVAAFINALGYTPYALAEARGFPRLVAMYHVLEIIPYGIAAYFWIGGMGILGAAMVWLLRMIITIPVFSFVSVRFGGIMVGEWWARIRRSVLVATLLMIVATIIGVGDPGANPTQWLFIRVVTFGCAVGFVAWRWVLKQEDRRALARLWCSVVARAA